MQFSLGHGRWLSAAFLALLCVSGAGGLAKAGTTADVEAAKAKVEAAAERRDCAEMWAILWPLAKAGNLEARGWLAGIVIGFGMRPPGRSLDLVSFQRDISVLSAHGAAGGDRASLDMTLELLAEGAAFGSVYEPLRQCLATADGKKRATCVDEAVAAGIIPHFDAFASEVDGLAKTSKAVCLGGIATLHDHRMELPPPTRIK